MIQQHLRSSCQTLKQSEMTIYELKWYGNHMSREMGSFTGLPQQQQQDFNLFQCVQSLDLAFKLDSMNRPFLLLFLLERKICSYAYQRHGQNSFFNIYLRAGSNHYLFIHQLRSSILPAGKMLSDQICYVLYILFLEHGANSKLRDFFPSRKDVVNVFRHSWNQIKF